MRTRLYKLLPLTLMKMQDSVISHYAKESFLETFNSHHERKNLSHTKWLILTVA